MPKLKSTFGWIAWLAILAPILLTPSGSFCRLSSGIAISGGFSAGTLEPSSVRMVPVAWISVADSQGIEWRLSIDYSESHPVSHSGMRRANRTALWLERGSRIGLLNRNYEVSGGAGWALWDYRLNSVSSLRGALGFRCMISILMTESDHNDTSLGLSYAGVNVPGTGLFDDLYLLQFSYRLFLIQ